MPFAWRLRPMTLKILQTMCLANTLSWMCLRQIPKKDSTHTQTASDHSISNPGTCHEDFATRDLVAAGQRNMAAQVGYGCDYQNKRLPIAVHEVKEWMKGQRQLLEELQDKPPGYVGARTAKRVMTDCYYKSSCLRCLPNFSL